MRVMPHVSNVMLQIEQVNIKENFQVRKKNTTLCLQNEKSTSKSWGPVVKRRQGLHLASHFNTIENLQHMLE